MQISISEEESSKILDMLAYRRLANSFSETAFIERYLEPIAGMVKDDYGNYILPAESKGSKVIISTHTDSVHAMGELQGVTAVDGVAKLSSEEKISNCLGADDAAGIYVALRMIEAGVRNVTYIFHRQEESFGKGSQWLADNHESWLRNFDICLALDRRGTSDIVTSQLGMECASSEFAESLAEQLGIGHKPAFGSFTDSASYMHIIPECSNLSVGYYNEHTRHEVLDLNYLELISQRLIALDWNRLVVKRIPEYGMFSNFGNVFV